MKNFPSLPFPSLPIPAHNGLKKVLGFLAASTVVVLFVQAKGFSQSSGIYVYPKQGETIGENPHAGLGGTVSCNTSSQNQCLYSEEPIVYLAINMHFIMNADGEYNFNEIGDGDGGTLNGYIRAEQIVDEANRQLEANVAQWGIDPAPAVCDINFRLVLKGVYFHRTNVGFNATVNKFNPATLWSSFFGQVYQNPSTELNVFTFESIISSGQANGIHATLHNVWSSYHNGENGTTPPDPWFLGMDARVLLHEVFHNNGLFSHPFENDGCNDTPTFFPGCWAWSPDPNNPCHTMASNNLMDYNEYISWSLTPCQICRLNEGVQGNFVLQGENCPPLNAFFSMPDEVCSLSSTNPTVWLQGSASFNETSHALEIYEVSTVGSNQVISGTYFSSTYTGEIGYINLRSYTGYNFQCGKIYRIKLSVSNTCADLDEQVRYVTFDCVCEDTPEPCTCGVDGLSVSPNPGDGVVNISFETQTSVTLDINIYSLHTGTLAKTVSTSQAFASGQHTVQASLENLPEGPYFVRINSPTGYNAKQFQIQR